MFNNLGYVTEMCIIGFSVYVLHDNKFEVYDYLWYNGLLNNPF